jgi:O-antigen ligase
MASPILAIFLSQAYHGEFKFSAYDWAARFLLAIPVFLALRRINMHAVAMLQYGIPIGALAGLALLVFRPYAWSGNVFTTGPFLNLIHFADLALMLGFLSLFAINRALHDSLPVLLLKSCGFLAGLYMALQTGERGAWVAIPVLVLLWIYGQGMAHPGRKLGITLLLLVIASVLAYNGIGLIHQRADMIYQNLVDYGNGHKDTSVGIRLQLWQAALHLFLQNPVFGLGPEGYAKMMPLLADQGMITPSAAGLGQGEVHNELLAKSAGLGIFGLFSIIAVHLVPMVILWRSLNARDAQTKVAGLMGMALVSGFFIFGLTVEIFNLKMTAAFYALTLAVLMAAATNRNEGH